MNEASEPSISELQDLSRDGMRAPVLQYEANDWPPRRPYRYGLALLRVSLRRVTLVLGAVLLGAGAGAGLSRNNEPTLMMGAGAGLIAFVLPVPRWKSASEVIGDSQRK
jgi:hypothetical protein